MALTSAAERKLAALDERVKRAEETLDLNGQLTDCKMIAVLARSIKANRRIRHVLLRDNNIGDHGCAALASVLATTTNWVSLNLSANPIGDEGLAKLANALKTNWSLTELNMVEIQCKSKGPIALRFLIYPERSKVTDRS